MTVVGLGVVHHGIVVDIILKMVADVPEERLEVANRGRIVVDTVGTRHESHRRQTKAGNLGEELLHRLARHNHGHHVEHEACNTDRLDKQSRCRVEHTVFLNCRHISGAAVCVSIDKSALLVGYLYFLYSHN